MILYECLSGVCPATAQPIARAPAPGREPARSPEDAEKQRIIDELARCPGNQTRAAEQLGISRRTLGSRLRKYRVPRPRKRHSPPQ